MTALGLRNLLTFVLFLLYIRKGSVILNVEDAMIQKFDIAVVGGGAAGLMAAVAAAQECNKNHIHA
ncbi:MAG: hypothetical protein K0Q85_1078, partial [Caproiciproducens sp.]|nr:hypothetical protein [Caproiciproducens sp.]